MCVQEHGEKVRIALIDSVCSSVGTPGSWDCRPIWDCLPHNIRTVCTSPFLRYRLERRLTQIRRSLIYFVFYIAAEVPSNLGKSPTELGYDAY
jgi:hypothetical protein